MTERDPWDAHWFGEVTLALYPERDEREARAQAAFVREALATYARAGRVRWLDLACATGRRAGALGPGGGATAGLDRDLALLATARRREPRLEPGVLCADLRRLPLVSRSVGAAVCFTGCFGQSEDARDDAALARVVARVLAPGGAFLAAGFNAERLVRDLVLREERTVAATRVAVKRRYDPASRMLEKEIELGTGDAKRVFARRARAASEHEVRSRLREAGLTVVGAWGDFDGSAFDRRRSPRLILLATRPSTKAFGGRP